MINPYELFSRDILDYQVFTMLYGMRSYVNLDNAATTPPLLSVEASVRDFFSGYGSVHRGSGEKSKRSTFLYESARADIKDFVGAPDDSYLLLCGNTTGGMNMLAHFFSFLEGKIAMSEIEHSSSFLPWIIAEGTRELGKKQCALEDLPLVNEKIQEVGLQQIVRYRLNENGEFCLSDIENILKENSIKAFVLTASSNLTGYSPDIREIGHLVHQYGASFVVDACQYIQHHPLNMKEMGIDFLVASGHKFYAPYGGGFVIGRKDFFDSFLPYQIGGGNLPYITKEGGFIRYYTEQAHDPGTPNAVAAVSMAAATKTLLRIGMQEIEEHESRLTKWVYDVLCDNSAVRLYVKPEQRTTIIPFTIEGINHIQLAEQLNADFGIGVRAGSFCVYEEIRNLLGVTDEEEIIQAVKRGDTSKIPGIVRASFSICNTERDVHAFLEAIDWITRGERRASKSVAFVPSNVKVPILFA
jgi:cysteine desulfurase/selenocysteine lyase